MNNFCTYFDSHYLARGLVMYDSLIKNKKNFKLYVFSFDKFTYDFLKKKKYKNIIPISYKKLENAELKKIKKTRTKVEYMWTCTPQVILYSLKKLNLKSCTYLDADLFFYDSPDKLIKESKNKSVIITKHRYSPRYDMSQKFGIFNVQFLYFRNDKSGNLILNDWKDKCIDWCYNRVEENKSGDQKYLDEWPTKFKNIHIMQNLGGGLGPWNIENYDIILNNNKIKMKNNNKYFNPVFFHFSGISIIHKKKYFLGTYRYKKKTIDLFFTDYLNKLDNKLNIFSNIKKKKQYSKIQSSGNLFENIKFFIKFYILKKNVINLG